MKASSRSLPFYKLKVGPCGSQVPADNLGICQSQARLPLQPKETFLSSIAFDLLQFALGLGTSHLSLYQLTIEPGTRFGELAKRLRTGR